ncbi:MAG: protein kinase [Phycisphaerae bacterium]|jgi:WD40 repeat protein/peroxiredoxin/predicted Ser/Thr protein kinase|nr:protein kinase [Phycisphaerae bacterium]
MTDHPDEIQVPEITDGPEADPSASMGPPPEIEGYRMVGPLGRGGMGTVWRAVQLSTQREVALKVISSGAFASDTARARFEREVELTAGLEHPNIARVYDSGVHRGAHYYAMELIDGEDLKQYVAKQKLSQHQTLELMRNVCQAVQHAHQRGVIHRDLKPSNILVTKDGQPHVLDFGLAKAFETESQGVTVSIAGQATGTPAYMSPEQASGQLDLTDTRSDAYSLGLILYRLLTGRSAHSLSGTRYDVIARISNQEIRRPRAMSKAVNRELEAILLKALARDPMERYASAGGLATDIDNYLAGEPLTARKPTTAYFLRKRIAKYRLPVGLVACGLLLLIGMAGWSYITVRQERDRATAAEKETANQRDLARQAQQDSEAAGRREAKQRKLAEGQKEIAQQQRELAEGQKEIAQQQRDRAEQREQAGRRLLYAAHMNLAMSAWENGNAPVTKRLLAQHEPEPGREDLRSFEWYYLWNLSHSEKASIIPGRVSAAAFSPDGKALVTAGVNGLTLRDPLTGRAKRTFRGARGAPIVRIVFLDGGKTLITVAASNEARLWDLRTLSERPIRHRGVGARGPVGFAAINETGTMAAVCAANSISVWDLTTGLETMAVKSRLGQEGWQVCSAAFSPDGKTLVTGAGSLFGDGELKLWDAATGREKLSLIGHSGQIYAAVFSPDGKTLITSASDATIRLWDATTGQGKACLRGHTHEINDLSLTADGSMLASAGADLTVRLWNVKTGECLATMGGHDIEVRQVMLAPKGNALLSISAGGTARLNDLSAGLGPMALRDHADEIRRVAFSPDSKTLATGSQDFTVKLWDVASGKMLATLKDHTSTVEDVAFSPDGTTLATCADDGTVRLWDLASNRSVTIHRGKNLVEDRPTCLAFAPDSSLLAVGMGYWRSSSPGMVKIWSVKARKWMMPLAGHRRSVASVAFSPDGSTLATGGWDSTAKLWNVKTGQEILTLKGHQSRLTMTPFSPDGKILATASWDRTGRLWDVKTGKCLFVLAGHRAGLYAAAFSPDGRTLATAGWDGLLKFWDVVTGQERATLKAHTRPIWSVAFSPDGSTMATGSRDNTIKLWRGATEGQVVRVRLQNQASHIATTQPKTREGVVAEIKAHLIAVQAGGGLTANDVQLAWSTCVTLEKDRSNDLAAEAFGAFAKIIAKARDQRIAAGAETFAGYARRLALTGKPMPLEGTTVEGKPFDWAPYRNKVVLVHFWSSTCNGRAMCSSCRTELTNIRQYYDLYRGRSFDVIGVSRDARSETLTAFLRRQPLPWATIHEPTAGARQPMLLRYGVRKRTSILIGRDGKVVSLHADKKELGKLLSKLLGPLISRDRK